MPVDAAPSLFPVSIVHCPSFRRRCTVPVSILHCPSFPLSIVPFSVDALPSPFSLTVAPLVHRSLYRPPFPLSILSSVHRSLYRPPILSPSSPCPLSIVPFTVPLSSDRRPLVHRPPFLSPSSPCPLSIVPFSSEKIC